MPARHRLSHTRWIALRRLLAVLGILAQVSVALSAVAEGREGVGAAAHVEAAGVPGHHYSHNESRCAACQARSVHSTAPSLPSNTIAVAEGHYASRGAVARSPRGPDLPTNPARAPPQVI